MDTIFGKKDFECSVSMTCSFASLLPVGVLIYNITDMDNITFEFVNEKFSDLTGITLLDIKKEPSLFFNKMQKEHLEHFYEDHKLAIENDIQMVWEGNIVLHDDVRWVRIQSNFNKGNNIIKCVGIIQDITLDKNVELLLRESETRFRGIFKNIPNVAIQGYLLDGTVTYWNNAAESFYGYSSNEAIGKNIIDLIIPYEYKMNVKNELKIMEETKKPIPSGELKMKHKDGSFIPVYSAHTIIYVPNVGYELFCIDTDLSKIKHIEQASKAKSEFLANMSHEIRTPLNAIVGLTHLIRKTGVTQKQIERLDQIDNSSRHLLSIINDILDLSKIEAGQLSIQINEFNLSSLIDTVTSLVGALAKEKGLKLNIDVQDVPFSLMGDSIRLRQVLLNFVGNAVKFTKTGSVTIRTQLVEDDGESLLVKFEIIDTGIGIKEEDLQRLFQPFEQVINETAVKNEGTGLGLAIAHRLAVLMGGDAGADSTYGKGSTFWFTARLKRGTGKVIDDTVVSSDEIEKKLYSRCKGAHILLAEDNDVNQLVASEMLKGVGMKVDIASNGTEAVEMFKSIKYDLVLMDIQMPVMDGLDATRAIFEYDEHNKVPIIAMTANVFDEGREEARESGMVDFIPKPVEPAQFYTVLHNWLTDIDSDDELIEINENTQDSVLINELRNIKELDVNAGLEIARHNERVYKQILNLFIESHKDDMDTILQLIADGKINEAERVVHALKGTIGNIGATKLHYYFAELDIALKCNDISLIDASLKRLINRFPSFVNELDFTLRKINSNNTFGDVLNNTEIMEVLVELRKLLERGNSKVIKYFYDNEEKLNFIFNNEDLVSFNKHINNFDFEYAREIIELYLRRMG